MSFGNAGLNKILRALNIELCFLNPQEIKILATIFQTSETIPELELIAYEPEDAKRLLEFMISQ